MSFMLRPYQTEAVEAILREFETVQSTLCVAPTGVGKSLIVAEVIRRFNQEGAVVLCHREELLHQMKETISKHCGLQCEIEQGEHHASEIFPADVLLASIQTLISGRNGTRRMNKFSPFERNLLVCDESHHSTSPSWRTVIDYFKSNTDLKLLGVTATPERSDEAALGQVYQTVAFDLPILQAIKDGWLVPVEQQLIDIQSLDFSHIHTVAGDLNQGELGAVMEDERNLYGICDAVTREIGSKRAIMFVVTVKQGQQACEILNRYKDGMACFASGKTNTEDRARTIKDFASGKHQVFVNVNLVSEGFDMPDADLLIDAAPTKSLLRYTQRLGRILRPLPGTVDVTTPNGGVRGEGDETCNASEKPKNALSNGAPTSNPEARRNAIAQSRKPIATVMDFVGNSGKHKLVHAVDVLGGKVSERVRELVERELRASGKPENVEDVVREAEERERLERERLEKQKRAKLTAKATYVIRTINPFDAFDLVAPPRRGWDTGKALSPKQRTLLQKQGIDAERLTYSEGKSVINELFNRWNKGLCSLRQAACLKKFGYDTKEMTRVRAGELITELKQNGWQRASVEA